MSGRRRGALVAAAALTALAPAARAARDDAAPPPGVSPYAIPHGRATNAERAAAHARWAEAARAAGDEPDARRHLAIACWIASIEVYDPDLTAPPCDAVRPGLAADGPVDAAVLLLAAEAAIAAWLLDVPRALDRATRALELGAALPPDGPDAGPVRFARYVLGAMMLEGGHYDRALAALDEVRRDSLAGGDPRQAAYADVWLCRADHLLGDTPRATERCAAAATALEADPDAYVAMNLAWAQGELAWARDVDAALDHYRRALELATAYGAAPLRAAMRNNIAAALVALRRDDEARAWLDELQRDVDAGRLPATYAPQIAEQWGELADATGDLDAAARWFERAAASPMHWLSIRTHGRLADVLARRGEVARARGVLEEAIRRIETERLTVDGSLQRAAFMTLHAAPYRELAALVAASGDADAAARALEIAEAGRARALRDALEATALAGDAAPPPTAAQLQAALGDGEALVELVAAARGVTAIVATRDAVRAVALPGLGDAPTLAARVSVFRALVQQARTDDELRAPARALHDDLLAPVRALAPAAHTLIVSPDGPLHDLPFDGLLGPDGFVVDALDVALTPSGALLARGGDDDAPPADPDAGALVVAVTRDVRGQGALPAALTEAAAVRRVLGGDVTMLAEADATEARLSALPIDRYAVLHFASHARLDAAMPLRSALVLEPGDGEDGWWRAEEIYGQRLRADLVVLSACSTALGAPAGGEGAMSLARAFLHAGAGATVATLWDVEDTHGPAFADELYQRAARGAAITTAVAAARRALRRRGAPPRAWAAYVVTGRPGHRAAVVAAAPAPPPPRGRSPAGRWLALAVGLAAVAGLVIALRRRRAPASRIR